MVRPSRWAAITIVAALGCGGADEPDFSSRDRGRHELPSAPEAPPEARCRRGDHAACLELGGSPDGANALGLARETADPGLGLELYLTACEGSSLAGCANAAALLRPRDAARAESLARRACDGGDASGCHNLATFLQDAERWEDAARVYRRGCELGQPMSCDSVGALAIAGRIAMDEREAVTFLRRACEQDDARGCANLGRALIRELDPPAGRAALARACELEHAASCYDLALSLGRGEGGPADQDAAVAAAQRGCALGSPEACGLLTPR